MTQEKEQNNVAPAANSLVNIGFLVALMLAIACLTVSAVYLFRFQSGTDAAVKAVLQQSGQERAVTELALVGQMYIGRVTLLSCGIFVGMSFGFLGFALFLLGVKGDVTAEGGTGDLKVKLERASPGLVVIVCATILIGTCATRSLPFNYRDTKGRVASGAGSATSEGDDDTPDKRNDPSMPGGRVAERSGSSNGPVSRKKGK